MSPSRRGRSAIETPANPLAVQQTAFDVAHAFSGIGPNLRRADLMSGVELVAVEHPGQVELIGQVVAPALPEGNVHGTHPMFGAAPAICEVQREGQFQSQELPEGFSCNGPLLFGRLIPSLIWTCFGVHVAWAKPIGLQVRIHSFEPAGARLG
ncbi:hypothetical protein D3C71_1589580 [compost metagenome]